MQPRLEVDQIHLRRTALHPEEDYALDLGGKCGVLAPAAVSGVRHRRIVRRASEPKNASHRAAKTSTAGRSGIDGCLIDYILYRKFTETRMAWQ